MTKPRKDCSDRDLLVRIDERTENMEKRLDGHGEGIRENRKAINDLAVYQGKCRTRWKGISYITISLFGVVVASLANLLLFN